MSAWCQVLLAYRNLPESQLDFRGLSQFRASSEILGATYLTVLKRLQPSSVSANYWHLAEEQSKRYAVLSTGNNNKIERKLQTTGEGKRRQAT